MQAAIADTWETLRLRVKNYRFTAFASLGLAATILVAAIWLRTPWVLVLGLVFFPLGAVFVWRDQCAVFDWEERIFKAWAESGRLARARAQGGPETESLPKSDFVMGIFIPAIANQPHRLSNSLKSMVANLPADPDYLPPQNEQIQKVFRDYYTRRSNQETRLLRRLLRIVFLVTIPVSYVYFRPFTISIVAGTSILALVFFGVEILLAPCVRWHHRKSAEKIGLE